MPSLFLQSLRPKFTLCIKNPDSCALSHLWKSRPLVRKLTESDRAENFCSLILKAKGPLGGPVLGLLDYKSKSAFTRKKTLHSRERNRRPLSPWCQMEVTSSLWARNQARRGLHWIWILLPLTSKVSEYLRIEFLSRQDNTVQMLLLKQSAALKILPAPSTPKDPKQGPGWEQCKDCTLLHNLPKLLWRMLHLNPMRQLCQLHRWENWDLEKIKGFA